MRLTWFMGLAAVALSTGCGNSTDAAKSGSAAASGSVKATSAKSAASALAAQTGSAVPAAPAASSASPTTAIPEGQSIAVKAVFEEFNGTYDGSKAIFEDWGEGKVKIYIPKDCPQFSCAEHDTKLFKGSCPKGGFIEVELEKVATGKTKTDDVHWFNAGGSNGTNNVEVDIASKTDQEIKGTLSMESKDDSVKGGFTAKLCPNPQ